MTVRKTRSLYRRVRGLSPTGRGTRGSVVSDLQGLVLAIQVAYFVVPAAIGAFIGLLGERGSGAAVGAVAGFAIGAAGFTAVALI